MTVLVIGVNLFRQPELFIRPRFFAEEGTNFFSFAYNTTLIDNLSNPQFGYYTLYNALITSFAAMFPLETVPLVTTCSALLVQIIASGYVIWGDLPLLETNLKRFAVAISFPLLCPGQIWLTTIGVQYWLCIITALILIEPPAIRSKGRHAVKTMILLLNGLTGILSCLMTPLFIYRWLKCRARQTLIYAATLCLCSITQLLIFYQTYLRSDDSLSMRFVDRYIPVFIYDMVISFFDTYLLTPYLLDFLMETKFKLWLDRILFNYISQDRLRDCESMMFLFGTLSALAVLPLAIRSMKSLDTRFLVLSIMIVYPLSNILSVGTIGGPRYLFAPGAILFTVIVSKYDCLEMSVFYRTVIGVFIVMTLLLHSIDFRTYMERAYHKSWPNWKKEVALWRVDKNHLLKIWPPPWAMQLKPRRAEQDIP